MGYADLYWFDLIVPIDSRLESLALEWLKSPDPHRRFTAIRALAYFPSKENADALRPFLTDMETCSPWEEMTRSLNVIDELGPWQGIAHYPIRIAAAASLHQMGYPAPKTVITDSPSPVYFRGWLLPASLLAISIAAGSAIRRVPFLRHWKSRAIFAALLFTALLAHSFFRAHLFAFTISSTYHDVSLYRGSLRYEVLSEFPVDCFPSYACVPIGEPEWVGMFATHPKTGRAGFLPWHHFQKEHGVGAGDQATLPGLVKPPFSDYTSIFNSRYPYQLTPPCPARVVTIPLWPAILLIILTALVLTPKIYRAIRRRRRLAKNLCPTCAYDLRAHHPGDLCPECGTLIPPKPALPHSLSSSSS